MEVSKVDVRNLIGSANINVAFVKELAEDKNIGVITGLIGTMKKQGL